MQRARAANPAFALTAENARAVVEICCRLDGLPLALELAAARTKLLSAGALLARLRKRLDLLTLGARDLPARQQTLRNTLDWSHRLLTAAEQQLFRKLSVFAGGCTMESAEAVCNTRRDLQLDLLEGMTSLVDKNLLQHVDGEDDEPRFVMLETIREFGLEHVAAGAEHEAAKRAHAAYCLVLAEEGTAQMRSAAGRNRWLALCDTEHDNFRAALDHLISSHDSE